MQTATTKAPRNRPERRSAAAGQHPRYTTLEGWRDLTGMSRSGTYRALAAGHLTAIKCGSRTLIDAEAGLAWLASLPAAEFRAPRAA